MSVTHYLWDEENDSCFVELDETGAEIATYENEPVPYGRLISQDRAGATSEYHYDAQGSTRQLTDNAQNVTDEYVYSAFGETVAKSGSTINPYGYQGVAGYESDGFSESIYVRARQYAARLGRWLSQDALRYVDEVNNYSFCKNSPIVKTDPEGMLTISLVNNAIGLNNNVCSSAYKLTLRVTPTTKLPKDQLAIVQSVCVFYNASYELCEYRGPEPQPKNPSCGCHKTKVVQPPTPCCFYELLVKDDPHQLPAITSGGCTSVGFVTTGGLVRVFRIADLKPEQIAKFKAGTMTCNDGLRDREVVTAAITTQKPEFWDQKALIVEEGNYLITSAWNCCEGGPWQIVGLDLRDEKGRFLTWGGYGDVPKSFIEEFTPKN